MILSGMGWVILRDDVALGKTRKSCGDCQLSRFGDITGILSRGNSPGDMK